MYLTKNETQIGTEQIYLWYIKLQTDTDYKCFWLQEFFIFYFHLHENWEIFPVFLNISHFKMIYLSSICDCGNTWMCLSLL